jgi:hypothetical protein
MARASDPYSLRRRNQRAAVDADQAEFAAVLRGLTNVDAGAYDERLSGALDDEARAREGERESWQNRDLEYDDTVGRIAEEVQRRVQMMGLAYPFELSAGRLDYKRSSTGFYEFCLAISCAPTITSGEFVNFPRFFERVVALLVQGYLGAESEVLHTGTPRDEEVGNRFVEAMKLLHERTGEWRWDPEEGLPPEPPTNGDEGVDFVAWLKSLDGRPGQIFLLGQCACGGDWEEKFHDIDFGRLYKWFRPAPLFHPVRLFATPHHLSDGHLREAQREAGLVLDRARLSVLAEKLASEPQLTAWHPRLQALRGLVLKPLGA